VWKEIAQSCKKGQIIGTVQRRTAEWSARDECDSMQRSRTAGPSAQRTRCAASCSFSSSPAPSAGRPPATGNRHSWPLRHNDRLSGSRPLGDEGAELGVLRAEQPPRCPPPGVLSVALQRRRPHLEDGRGGSSPDQLRPVPRAEELASSPGRVNTPWRSRLRNLSACKRSRSGPRSPFGRSCPRGLSASHPSGCC